MRRRCGLHGPDTDFLVRKPGECGVVGVVVGGVVGAGIDFEKVVEDYEEHGEGAEEDGEGVEG